MHKRIEDIHTSGSLKLRWERYTKDYNYAKGISYDNVIAEIKVLVGKL